MEGLAPPLKCLIEMQSALQNGETVRKGLQQYLQAQASDRSHAEYAEQIRAFLFAWEQGREWRSVIAKIKSPYRRALLELASMGLAGHPVLGQLEELRTEIIAACDLEIRTHLELLPVKMLAPLLFFQFPAYLLLLFGPLLKRLIEELSR